VVGDRGADRRYRGGAHAAVDRSSTTCAHANTPTAATERQHVPAGATTPARGSERAATTTGGPECSAAASCGSQRAARAAARRARTRGQRRRWLELRRPRRMEG